MTAVEALQEALADLRAREVSLAKLRSERISEAARRYGPSLHAEVERLGYKLEGLRLAITRVEILRNRAVRDEQ